MKKIKAGFRRTICILLAAVSLSMSVTSSYYGATTAYAAEAGITIELLELLLASLGFTATNMDDLYSVQKRLNGAAPTSGMSQEELAAYQEMCTLSAGEVLDLTKEEASGAWSKLKARVSSVIYDINKATVDKDMEITSVGNIPIYYKTLSASDADSLCGNLKVGSDYINPSDYMSWEKYNDKFICTIYGFQQDSTGHREYCFLRVPKADRDNKFHLEKVNDSIGLFSTSGSHLKMNVNAKNLVKESASSSYLVLDNYWLSSSSSTYGGLTDKVVYLSDWIADLEKYGFSFISIYSYAPVYESFEDYVAIEDVRTSNPVSGFIYGSSAAALAIGGTIALRKGGAITQEVADAISALKAENPDATDEDINETVAGVLAGIGELDSSIEEGNDIAASSNSWLEKIHDKVSAGFDMSISAIHAAIMALGTSVTSKLDLVRSAIVDGTSALQEEVDDIREQFTVIEGGGGQEPDQDPDPDPEDPIPVWIPVLPAVVKFLKPVLNFFANPLSIITQYLHVYQKLFVGWQEWIKGTYDNVTGIFFNQMPQILNILNSLLNQAIGFPAALAPFIVSSIVEALEKIEPLPIEIPAGIPIEFPDSIPLELPEGFSIPNYMSILQQILEAIQNIFGLDMVAIQAAALGLTGSLDGCFPDLGKIRDIFAGFHFSDSSEYPVIKVQTPQIIKEHGYDKEYIILCDFSDYAVYCVWVRRLCRLMIWLAFAYTIFSHFKVRFSIT